MRLQKFLKVVKEGEIPAAENFKMEINPALSVEVYSKSVNKFESVVFFIARANTEKYLFLLGKQDAASILDRFEGEIIEQPESMNSVAVKRCYLNHHNARQIQQIFAWTRPRLIGLHNSFGFGDRLGLANPAHVRSLSGSDFLPVIAQQSIRELTRTGRSADEVMDAAVWAVFQEGYKKGFGADADHLKTTADIDRMVKAGFTMFTFDPGDYVVNEADALPENELESRVQTLNYDFITPDTERFVQQCADQPLRISGKFSLQPDRKAVLSALLKYGGVIDHTAKMFFYLKKQYPDHPAEIELSVDETDSVTSPFEHFFVVSELKKLGVELISLAPRFVGRFEKGIDYIGDLAEFRREYLKHLKIAEFLGPYKISLHSGSDKFGVYAEIGALGEGHVHVKTAGTSYLEALKTAAKAEPGLFREILDFSRDLYQIEKKSYHVSADILKVPPSNQLSDFHLLELFEQNDARQILHVTFGKVLTGKNEDGSFRFKDRLIRCLKEHEETHYRNLVNHFQRHLQPFL
jgi:hypothetical protein